MPRAAQAALAPPEEEVAGADTAPPLVALAQANMPPTTVWPLMRAPNCTVTIQYDHRWGGAPWGMAIGDDAVFDERRLISQIAVELHHPERRWYMEDRVTYSLREDIRREARELVESMDNFALATQIFPHLVRRFSDHLADFVYGERVRAPWQATEEGSELYVERATLDRRHWIEAVSLWNEEMGQHAPTGATQYTYAAANTNIYDWHIPVLQTGRINADQARALYGFDFGINQMPVANTTAINVQWTWDNTTTSGLASYGWPQSLGPCECASAGTCSHCVNRARDLEISRQAERKRELQKQIAAKRGRKLLLSLLDERQLRDYANTQSFLVTAADGRVFRLRKGKTAQLLDEHGRVAASYCIHLFADRHDRQYHYYCAEDTTIAQLFTLEHSPQEFDRIANITKHYQPTIDPAQAQRYLQQHERETEAILRAEGIANPRQWVDGLRRDVRDRYMRGDDARIVEQGQIRQAIANAVVEDEIFNVDAVAAAA